MIFKKYYFEELNDNVDGIVYFVNKSNLKPKGFGSISFKLPRFLDFLL